MKVCRACGYTRRPEDTAADYECPKCGRVYAKSEARYRSLVQCAAADSEPNDRGAAEPAQQQSAQDKVSGVIALIAIVLAVGYFGVGYLDKWHEERTAQRVASERKADAQRLQAERAAERERLAREQAVREADPEYIAQRERERQALQLAREREALQARRAQDVANNVQSITRIHNVATRWDELLRVAEATPRIALAGPVQQMQAIRRETVALQVSTCAQPAKTALVRAMDFRITQFLEFMRNHTANSSAAIRGYEGALRDMQRALNACV